MSFDKSGSGTMARNIQETLKLTTQKMREIRT